MEQTLAADKDIRLSQVRKKIQADNRRRLADAAGEAEKAQRRQRSIVHQVAVVRAAQKLDR